MATSKELHLDSSKDYHPLRLAGAGRFWDRDGQTIVDQWIERQSSRDSTPVAASPKHTSAVGTGHTTGQYRTQTVTLRVHEDARYHHRGRSLEAPKTSLPTVSRPFSPLIQRPRARSTCQDELFLPPTPSFRSWEFPHNTTTTTTNTSTSTIKNHNLTSPVSSRSPSPMDTQRLNSISDAPPSLSSSVAPSLSDGDSLFSDIDLIMATKLSIYSGRDDFISTSPAVSDHFPSPVFSPTLNSSSQVTKASSSINGNYRVRSSTSWDSEAKSKSGMFKASQAIKSESERRQPAAIGSIPTAATTGPSLEIPEFVWSEKANRTRAQLSGSYGESKFNTLPGEPFPFVKAIEPARLHTPLMETPQTHERKSSLGLELSPDPDLLPWFVRYAGGKGVNIYKP